MLAFTAVEYDYFAKKNKIPLEEVFKRLMDAGVEALPGGGAEIFSAPYSRYHRAQENIRAQNGCPSCGQRTKWALKPMPPCCITISRPRGYCGSPFQIRDLQDETGGFKTFVPLQFHGENTKIDARRSTTGYDDIRIYAASRIFLHNVPHLKALWMYLGDKMAQVLLRFGVDDIGATYHNEKVVHAAGAQTPDFGSEPFLRRLIHEAQLIPERTTASYRNVSDQPERGWYEARVYRLS